MPILTHPFKLSATALSVSILTVSVLAPTLAPTTANAAGFALREQSTYGQGMSFAGVAAGGDISTSFWNPANTSEVGESMEFSGQLSIIDAKTDIKTTGASNVIYGGLNETGDTGGTSAIPAIYFASRINEATAWGLSLTVPFGLGTEAERGSRSQYVALESSAESINITPTVTYEAAPGLNIGAGLQLQKFDVTLTSALPVGAAAGRFSALDPVLELAGDDTSVGYTLGVNYTAGKTAFGLGYRSSIDHELEGQIKVSALGFSNDIKVDLETPSLLTLGIKHQATNAVTLAATVERADWSTVGIIPVQNARTGGIQTFNGSPIALPFGYKDTTYYSFGGEYAYSANTVLRTGIGYDETTVRDNTRTTRLPDNDRYWLSFGATHTLSSGVKVDWGFTHVRLKEEAVININQSHIAFNGLPYTGTADPTVNILSVAFTKPF